MPNNQHDPNEWEDITPASANHDDQWEEIGPHNAAQYGIPATAIAHLTNSFAGGKGPELDAWLDSKLKGADYDKALAERRQVMADMAQQNPTTASLASFGGSVAQAVNPVTMAAGRGVAGLNLAGRIAGGAALGAAGGAIQDPGQNGSRLDNAQTGAMLGGALPVAGAAIGLASKPLARIAENVRFAANPAQVESEAVKSIAAARNDLAGKLSASGKALGQELTGNTVQVAPEALKGVSPRLDEIVERFIKPAEGELKGEITANSANRLRRAFDDAAKWKPAAPGESAVSNVDRAKQAANVLRSKVGEVSPEIGNIQSGRKDLMNLMDYLKKGKPYTRTNPSTVDKAAQIQRIAEETGVDLSKVSDRYKQGKALAIESPNSLADALKLIPKAAARVPVELGRLFEKGPAAGQITPAMAALLSQKKEK